MKRMQLENCLPMVGVNDFQRCKKKIGQNKNVCEKVFGGTFVKKVSGEEQMSQIKEECFSRQTSTEAETATSSAKR